MKTIFSCLTLLLGVSGILAAGTQAGFALVIDSFDTGAYVDSDGFVDASFTQESLDTTEVLGGTRQVNAMWDGNLQLAQGDGSLTMGFDGGMFEVSLLRYGALVSDSQGDYLNADFTAEGHDRLRIDMSATTPTGPSSEPGILRVTLFSGLESGSVRGSSALYMVIATGDSYYYDLDYDWFQDEATATLDLTDIDGISVELFAPGSQTRIGEISLDQIATAAAPIAGDFNADGMVDMEDYGVWKSHFGVEGPINGDGNGDHVVDLADYTLWRNNLDAGTPTPVVGQTTVPEPATWLLAIGAVLAAGCMRPAGSPLGNG